MTLLPPRNTGAQAYRNTLFDLKKGKKQTRHEFIWDNQERFYAIAFMATGQAEAAVNVTIQAFQNVFSALTHVEPRQITGSPWQWLSQFIVETCVQFHRQFSSPPPDSPEADASADGSEQSEQMDWQSTVIPSMTRITRCLSTLPEKQRQTYILRHQLGLACDQVAAVLNQHPDDVMAMLFKARVQVVKCLGRL